MLYSGPRIFAEADDYAEGLGISAAHFVVTGPGTFWTRVARLALPHLELLELTENQPRVGYIAPAPERLHMTYMLHASTPMFWSGVPLQRGDLSLVGSDDALHQRVTGPAHWGLLSLDPAYFAAAGHALTGLPLTVPRFGRLLRPPPADARRLLSLHIGAARFAEKQSRLVRNPEVARAIEHDLIACLHNCLSPENERADVGIWRHRAEILRRLETFFEANTARSVSTAEFAAAAGVSERTLRSYCADSLGVSPSRYARLRRLKLVRAALRSANPGPTMVADVARRFGFVELGRFAAMYQAAFGELPSTTLRVAWGR